ncbi:tRNA-splicing endonuclease subunit [Savitreella phatthalungensis]
MIDISRAGERYLVFDIRHVRELRERHHICGMVVGTLPQIPQQSLFLGLPLLLQPEEVSFLVKRGHARVVDELTRQRRIHTETTDSALDRALALRDEKNLRKARSARTHALEARKAVLRQKGLDHLIDKIEKDASLSISVSVETLTPGTAVAETFSPLETSRLHLFEHLHENGYYMTPGLRFGGDFVAYPGDPLRYHSHFTCTAHAWQESFSMLDLVAGGRLGTGVKKAWLIGGKAPEGDVRCFTIEWAGM